MVCRGTVRTGNAPKIALANLLHSTVTLLCVFAFFSFCGSAPIMGHCVGNIYWYNPQCYQYFSILVSNSSALPKHSSSAPITQRAACMSTFTSLRLSYLDVSRMLLWLRLSRLLGLCDLLVSSSHLSLELSCFPV